MYKDTFERKEIKYLLTNNQYKDLLKKLEPIAEVDQYGKTQILNIYFDTPDFKLIKRSLEHPEYKEKLRLRSYGKPNDDTKTFIEIKKKYKGIVYKRRIGVSYKEAVEYLEFNVVPKEFLDNDSSCVTSEEIQIQHEIQYFLSFYKNLKPAMAIAYDRVAFVGIDNPELRLTFDSNLRWSIDEFDLHNGNHGEQILEKGQVLMELKILGAIDLRLAHILSELKIFPISFSKYGRGYIDYEEELLSEKFVKEKVA